VPPDSSFAAHKISIVVPVYQGELTLGSLIEEIAPLTGGFTTPAGAAAEVTEVLLVNDCGPDNSPAVIRDLAARYGWVRPVWLSRNYGQHAATLAGMASSGGEWIVTMDEDGQHNPADIGVLLDAALAAGKPLVYADPVNKAPHGALRNLASRTAKRLVKAMSGGADASVFQSFRLISGEIGRSVAAYAGAQVYLDVALSWVAPKPVTAPVTLRAEGRAGSGYTLRSLIAHFWRMALTSGTRPLRFATWTGAAIGLAGVVYAVFLVIQRLLDPSVPLGWTSTVCVVLVTAGVMLMALGMVAEYVGVSVNMAMGKPLYLIVADPATGPLGRVTGPAPAPGQPAASSQPPATPAPPA
jgi:undecaprenyl-phosphate 4-deoxy-4-formamido-L-arabinose transferase